MGQGMPRLVAAAGYDNPGALLSEGQRGGVADPGQGAGDQDDGCSHGCSPLESGLDEERMICGAPRSLEGTRDCPDRVAVDEAVRAHATRTLAASWNDPLAPEIRKHPKEHLLGVHQVVESETAGLTGIGDNVVIRCEHAVGITPRRNLSKRNFWSPFLSTIFSQIGPLSAIDCLRLRCRG